MPYYQGQDSRIFFFSMTPKELRSDLILLSDVDAEDILAQQVVVPDVDAVQEALKSLLYDKLIESGKTPEEADELLEQSSSISSRSME